MSSVSSISSNLFKKSIPLYASTSTARGAPLLRTLNGISFKKLDQEKRIHASSAQTIATDPSDLPAKSPPEVPTAPPNHKPGIPPEMPRTFIKEPEFDPIPLEEPADPPPAVLTPDFPGQPNPSPPEPKPPAPSPPVQPEVIPPRGPDIVPPQPPEPGEVIPPRQPPIDPPHGPDVKPPEPGFPRPTQPDIPEPMM